MLYISLQLMEVLNTDEKGEGERREEDRVFFTRSCTNGEP